MLRSSPFAREVPSAPHHPPRPGMTASPWRWFGVKTLFRTRAVGEPAHTDEHFRPGWTLVEERIVLLRARSGAEALRRAEREAAAYVPAEPSHNRYGQRIETAPLGCRTAFELFDDEARGLEGATGTIEVFSQTHRVPESTPDDEVCERFLGPREMDAEEREMRWRTFVDVELAGGGEE